MLLFPCLQFLIYKTCSNAHIYSVHEISHARFSGSSFVTLTCNSEIQVKVELCKETG